MKTAIAFGLAAVLAVVSLKASSTALDVIPYPGGRPPSSAEVALGKTLFFETRLSSNDEVSCATCHRPDKGFADGQRFSIGVAGTPLKRHTPHLYNLAWNRTFFWDGRA